MLLAWLTSGYIWKVEGERMSQEWPRLWGFEWGREREDRCPGSAISVIGFADAPSLVLKRLPVFRVRITVECPCQAPISTCPNPSSGSHWRTPLATLNPYGLCPEVAQPTGGGRGSAPLTGHSEHLCRPLSSRNRGRTSPKLQTLPLASPDICPT